MPEKGLMTDDELIAEVERCWAHWAGHLGLINWWIDVRMMDEEEAQAEGGSSDPVALTITHHIGQYQRAYLKVHPDQGKRVFSLSMSVLHESLHVFLAAFVDKANESAPK